MNKNEYKYIWSTKEEIEFKVSEEISPYMEINEAFINTEMDRNKIVVNPYIRFFDIFYHFNEVEVNKSKLTEVESVFKKDFENRVFLYLKKLDFIKGTTVLDIYCENIISELKKGLYGENIKKYIKDLKKIDQKMIAMGIIKRIFYEYEEFKILKIMINNFFKDNIIYKQVDKNKKIILYLNYEKNKENISKMKIIKELFLPLGQEMKIYWTHHFGIIDLEKVFVVERMGVF